MGYFRLITEYLKMFENDDEIKFLLHLIIQITNI